MKIFDEILGQAAVREVLCRMLSTGRLPHALLLQGPEGAGKATVARAFAAALLCTAEGSVGCGECEGCRLAARGSHPDLTIVERLPRKDRPSELAKDVTIDQIRRLSQLAALSPRQGRHRVFLIDPADRMNRFAQNALLKTLEEPSGRVVLMLIASRPHLLLPTVRSRCFALRFGALRTVELAGLLQQRGIERAEALERASLAGGLPGKALAVDLDSLRERRGEILAVLESLAGDPTAAAELSPMAARIAGKDERTLVEGLDLLESLLRDAARAGERSPDAALIHADLADRLAELGARLGPQRAAALVRSAERLRRDLRFNLNRVLIAEGLLAAAAGGPLP